MIIKLDLDPEMGELLARSAVAERRPLAWQAEVLLWRALKLDASTPATPPSDDLDEHFRTQQENLNHDNLTTQAEISKLAQEVVDMKAALDRDRAALKAMDKLLAKLRAHVASLPPAPPPAIGVPSPLPVKP